MVGEAKENHQRQDIFVLLHNAILLPEYLCTYLAKRPLKNRSRAKTRALVSTGYLISKVTP